MPIEFECSNCGQHFHAPDEYAGRKARCKRCGTTVLVPNRSERSAEGVEPSGETPTTPSRDSTPVQNVAEHPPAGSIEAACPNCKQRFFVDLQGVAPDGKLRVACDHCGVVKRLSAFQKELGRQARNQEKKQRRADKAKRDKDERLARSENRRLEAERQAAESEAATSSLPASPERTVPEPPAHEATGSEPERIAHFCPQCGSDQFQTLKMIYESGSATTESESAHSGVGLFGGTIGGVGLGSTSTSGITRTRLAELATPPTKKEASFLSSQVKSTRPLTRAEKLALYAAAAISGTLTVFSMISGLRDDDSGLCCITPFLILFVVLCFGIAKGGVFNTPVDRESRQRALDAEYGRRYQKWLNTVMCLRCGATWSRVHSDTHRP